MSDQKTTLQAAPRKRYGRIVKLLVSMTYFAGDTLRRYALRLLGRKPSATYVVLYYHDVPDSQREMFARQMDLTLSLTVPISTQHQTAFVPGQRYSAITFDDGFDNSLDNAVPELTARNIPATFFVSAGFLDRNADWWPSSEEQSRQKIASLDRWQQLPTNLFTIGSHTVNHPHLPALPEQEARAELRQSRTVLMQALKRDIEAFSFPYGEFTPGLVALCKEVGYKQVYTTLPENSVDRVSRVLIGRTPAEPSDWPIEFRLKLMGAYRWLPSAISFKGKIMKAIVRNRAHANTQLRVGNMMHERNR